jgi:hypothetical protein
MTAFNMIAVRNVYETIAFFSGETIVYQQQTD